MEHVVFFPAPDGSPAFRRFADLPEAVRFVEHLRNVANVIDASVHALTEIPLSFKAWYRVELPTSVEDSGVAADQRQVPQAQAPAEPVVAGSATGLLVPDQPLVADQFTAPPVQAESAPPVQAEPEVVEVAQVAEVAGIAEPVGVQDVLAQSAGRRERGIGFFAR